MLFDLLGMHRKDITHSREGVNGTAVDIKVLFWQHLGTLVDGSSRSIKDTAKHVLRDTELKVLTGKLDTGLDVALPVSHKPSSDWRLGSLAFFTSIPGVPSKTWTTARSPNPVSCQNKHSTQALAAPCSYISVV